MNFIKKIFGIKDKPKATVKEPEKYIYTIEYYPETKRYFPTCNGMYFKNEIGSGIITLREDDMVWTESTKTKEEAKRLIDKHYEQQSKENVIIEKVSK